MILGIGTDICAAQRFESYSEGLNEMTRRILVEPEQAQFMALKQAKQRQFFLAKRFAAKEALSKALGCGISGNFSFQDAEVMHTDKGQPMFQLSVALLQQYEHAINTHLSISDDGDFAIAMVIIETL